ncbi:MAG: VCBS repeat-containing protein [Deltaproteobacteria bacterium]|nr:VCBS repeat-containing protein [Deltaproteobacteria bacterium]
MATSPPGALAETLSFDGQRAYPVGANPKGLSVGDCDGDGVPDLVTAAQNSNEVVILRNPGDGNLEFGGGKTNVSQPTGATCGDFNGDGLVDLAAVSRLGDIGLYFGDGLGTFTPGGARPAGVAPTSLISADLNDDGWLDLVAVDSTSQDITILLGTGTSALPPFVRVRTPIQSPRAAAVADFDLDGYADIAVAGATAPYVVILYGNGVGFATRTNTIPNPFTQTRRPTRGRGIAAADMNQDGYPDLALLSSDGVITLFLGSPSGQFAFFDAFSVSSDAEAIALPDLNGDGLVDLALLASDTNSAQVFLAIGQGQFDLPTIVSVESVSNGFGPVVSRTVLTDPTDPLTSVTQLMAADGVSKMIRLVEQSDPMTLATSPLVAISDVPVALALGDVTGDGIADAAVLTKAPRGRSLQLSMLLGTVAGQYDPLPPVSQGTCGNGILETGEQCDDGNLKARDGCSKLCAVELGKLVPSLAFADLDGDTKDDIVLANDRGQVLGLMADGQGRFREIRLLGTARKKTGAALGDFTGDGTPDVAFVSKASRGGAVTLLSNFGDGTFTTTPLPVTLPVVGPLLAGDFDRNGLPDLAAGYRGGWAVLYNDGTGPTRPSAVALPKAYKRIAQMAGADFDEDGWLDLFASFGSKKVPSLLFRGSATGSFSAGEIVGSASDPLTDPFAVDLDQDDHQDIVSCSSENGLACRVFYGDGAGQFGAAALPSSVAVGREPRSAGTADFDQDGIADVVGVSRNDDRAVVLFGGPSSPTSRLVLSTGSRPSDVEVLDLNNDGFLDFVIGNEASRDLSIFVNQTNRQFLALAPVRLPSLPNSGLGLIALASGDIDSDGTNDLVAVQAGGQAGGTVTPLINVEGVGLAVLGSFPVGNLAWGVAVGRLNDDGVLDIVTANRSDNTFSVLLSQPGGGYTRSDYDSGGVRATDVAVADLGGDGFDDVIVTNEMIDAQTTNYGNVVTFMNDGAGGFSAATLKHVRGREIPRSVCAGDFDNDGRRDVAVASLGSNDVMVLYGAGNGTWRNDERLFPVGDGPLSVSCRDSDGDDRSDIAFGRRGGSEVGVILTNQ